MIPTSKQTGTKAPRRRRSAGATFAELMLATLVVGSAVVASTASLARSTEVYHFFAEGPHEALMLAQEIHEAAMLLPWEAPADGDPQYGPNVYTLWDLDELEIHPPRSAEYEVVVSHPNWEQSMAIRFVDAEDPETEVDPETFEGNYLVELEVTIHEGQDEIGSHTWWMTDPSESEG